MVFIDAFLLIHLSGLFHYGGGRKVGGNMFFIDAFLLIHLTSGLFHYGAAGGKEVEMWFLLMLFY